MSSVILEAHDLTKEYRHTVALDHIDLKIEKGKIYGFIGQNGAGKTTFLRLVTGLAFPTSGTLSLWGKTVEKELQEQRKRIGCMIEALYPDALRSGRFAPCAGGRVHEAPITKQTDPGHPEQPIRKRRTRRPAGPAPGVFLWGIFYAFQIPFRRGLEQSYCRPINRLPEARCGGLFSGLTA